MGIREITYRYDSTSTNENGEKLHKAWELDISNNTLVLERYGSFCGWSELKLKKKEREVYRITKLFGGEERTEYFFHRLTRAYNGDQFSFVEYITRVAEKGRFPAAEEDIPAGLDSNIRDLYRENLQKILDPETLLRP